MQSPKEYLSKGYLSQNKKNNIEINQISFDSTENNTRSSGGEKENFKDGLDNDDEIINIRTHKIKEIKKEKNFLNKKIKKSPTTKRCSKEKKEYKSKSGKYKLINKLFNEFKSCSPLYKEYPQFLYIEKNIKNNLYSTINELAKEIRNIFSQIFFSCSQNGQSEEYNKSMILCDSFEKILNNYDNKLFSKESKSLLETINKLKKELRQTELLKNNYKNSFPSSYKNKNKYKIQINVSDKDNFININNLKNELSNKINKLTKEQKKGILKIIPSTNSDEVSKSKMLKLDLNKMSFEELNKLQKYVDNCVKNNIKINNNDFVFDINAFSKSALKLDDNFGNNFKKSNLISIEEEKKENVIKNDDLSSNLSDDYDDEDD